LANYPLLEGLNSPKDLRALPEEALPQLCDELRAYLLEVISEVGGHLSSSLGVVELTVALHYTLDTPEDLTVWDVGHQAYIHKILTGRREALKTNRQYGGISGFLKRSESEYDAYGAGHASTALSAAYGMAVARDLAGKNTRVAAIFGDGALTGGLCYEGLNNAGGARHRRFLAILNDNQMSISPNVGAIHRYLNNFVQTPLYQRFRRQVREGLERIPRVGKPMTFLARRIEEGAKGIITPGALFEALGFDYYGPVDGHDIRELVKTLRNLRNLDHPVLLHVLTVKGKGYAPAEESPEGYHGVKPFCPDEGIVPPSPNGQPAFQEVFGAALLQLAQADRRVVGITAAMPTGTGILPFAEAFPSRFFDVGIAEEHATVFAAGLATQGMRPVCAIYSTFLQRAYDPIMHDCAIQHLPVMFCMDRAGLAGEDGPTHHGTLDLAYLRHVPGMVVSAPKDGNELRNLMATALAYDGGPFAIRYPKAGAGAFVPGAAPEILPMGTWEVLRPGKDAAILAVGPMTGLALKAAESLMAKGLDVEVVNCRFIKPLDEAYLAGRLASFSRVLTVEEGTVQGGFGSAVLEWRAAAGVATPVHLLGLPDRYIPHGSRAKLLQDVGLTAEGLERALTEGWLRPALDSARGAAASG
jgi:1-deoxy-D-xylulose-5-phosphate synthase